MTPAESSLPTVVELIGVKLGAARWFAGRNRPFRVTSLIPLPLLTDEIPQVRLEIAEVRYDDDPEAADHYLVLLCYRAPADPAGPGLGVARHPRLGLVAVHEAAADPYAMDRFLALASADTDLSGEGSRLRSHLLDGSRLRPGLHPRRFSGEQSNTSLMYGEVAMLKFFRRLEPGHNLDIEVHRALADTVAAPRVARLFGWLEADWTDGAGATHSADLGMLVEQFRGAHDGWDHALGTLERGTDFAMDARTLGQALRDVHAGLLAAFGPDQRTGGETAQTMRTRLGEAIAEVPQLSPLHGALDSRLSALADHDYVAQRVHGDFHLGQALLVADTPEASWRIIDFEGEPLKSLEDRREPDTVWRDVAGMLRSFDYAGAYAAREWGMDPAAATTWAIAARTAFLRAYAGRELDPDEQRILRAYLIDKAVYECCYEARHRPEWLPIPLAALAALAGTTDDTFDGGRK